MKRLILFLFLATLVWSQTGGWNSQQSTTFTSVTTGLAISQLGGVKYHQILWTPVGSPASCTVAIDSSSDGISWSAGGILAGQTCTSFGQSAVISASANYIRVNVTALTAATSVQINYVGYATNPAGGGTGSGTVTSAGFNVNSDVIPCGAITLSGTNPITTSGIVNLQWTGVTGDILTFNGSNCPQDSSTLLSSLVPKTTTVNGYALSAAVTVSKTDVGLGNVTNDVQTKAAVVPNTAPSDAQILIAGSAGAYVPKTITGCTLTDTGALSCAGGGVAASYTFNFDGTLVNAVNNSTGATDATGTDLRAVWDTITGLVSGGHFLFKDGIYPCNSLDQESTGGFSNYYCIGIPGGGPSQYPQWIIEGETADPIISEFGTPPQTSGVIFNLT